MSVFSKVWNHLKRYNPYSLYAAKSELKGEVSSSYLTWIWVDPGSGSFYACLCIYYRGRISF